MNQHPDKIQQVCLQKAALGDCEHIHAMQIAAFRQLLAKYHDYSTNPGAEPLARIAQRMKQADTDYYLILVDDEKIGVIRVVRINDAACRIAPMFILPAYQGKGYAQQAISAVESMYSQVNRWELDTIREEKKLCHLYEKMGYQRTGREERIQDGMTIVYYAKEIARNK